jgi:hypothetical protein
MRKRRDHADADERAAAFRRQSRHRQSPPWAGIGSRAISSAHQQFPDRSHPNSVPHPEQISRRWLCCPICWVMNKEARRAGVMRFDNHTPGIIGGESREPDLLQREIGAGAD